MISDRKHASTRIVPPQEIGGCRDSFTEDMQGYGRGRHCIALHRDKDDPVPDPKFRNTLEQYTRHQRFPFVHKRKGMATNRDLQANDSLKFLCGFNGIHPFWMYSP